MKPAAVTAVEAVRCQIAVLRDQCARLEAAVVGEARSDVTRIDQSAADLLAIVERLDAGADGERDHLRHDVCGAINNIMLYAEIVRDDLGDDASELMLGGLSAIQGIAAALAFHVDALTSLEPAMALDPLRARLTEGARLLLVDDDEDTVRSLTDRLHRLGYRVTPAVRGEDALELQEREPFDAVLLDIMMPGVDGDQVLRRLRERAGLSRLPVIMLTARNESSRIVSALRDGANDYIVKPVDLPVLVARIETQLELRRLSMLEEEFCAIASHDLKGILTSMAASLYLVDRASETGARLPDAVAEHLQAFRRGCAEMGRLIDDFLGFEAMEHGRLSLETRSVDVARLVRDATETHAGYARSKRILLRTELEEPAAVRGDPARLSQVLGNLLGNAIKFTPQGGSVLARVRVGEGKVTVELHDSGPGLSASDVGTLFTRHPRCSNLPTAGESSTGLGLYICKRLVDLHHGEIGADNRPGGGSTFWVRLPAA